MLTKATFADCPLFTYPENHKLDQEINNVCQQFQNPIGNNLTYSSGTFTYLKVSSITVGQLAVSVLGNVLNAYRRPVLQYNSGTVINVETGIDGTSGEAQILFPDGVILKDSTAGDIQINLSQVAAFNSGTIQSGLRTGSTANNTLYSFYAVKVTKSGSTSRFVGVADIIQPTQGNFSTLNSNFGTNGWVYLGTLPYGDNSGTVNAIIKFSMTGNFIMFRNACSGNAQTMRGYQLATHTAQVGSISWSYATGTSVGTNVPATVTNGVVSWAEGASTGDDDLLVDAGNVLNIERRTGTAKGQIWVATTSLVDGLLVEDVTGTSVAKDLDLSGYWDNALGVGSNPQL